MQQLNLPPFNIKVAEREGQTTIYDFLRHRYLRLTPEEWVRQHFTHFLVEHKGYPTALLANEVIQSRRRNATHDNRIQGSSYSYYAIRIPTDIFL